MSNALPISVVTVTGSDAKTFLQGQLTQDMATLDNSWNYVAQCNPKGRVTSLFKAFSIEDTFYLLLDSTHTESTLSNLKKYVMRSDVVFTETDLKAFYVGSDVNGDNSVSTGDGLNLSLPIGNLILSEQEVTESNTPDQWYAFNIENTIPLLHEATLGEHTPEELSLDLLGAVSFTKGCYTGQEVVARMHYLGKAKKRLFTAAAPTTISPELIGEKVHNAEGKAIGKLIDTNTNSSLNSLVLISANTDYCNEQTLSLEYNNESLVLIAS